MLDIWPALPFVIIWDLHDSLAWDWWFKRHHERICRITVSRLACWHMEKLAVGMCRPFPMLTSLQLSKVTQSETSLPDSFLGRSAPRLRNLTLIAVSFPALPNLLLSANDLVHLDLWDIPVSGYIPPDAMVDCLSTLTRLSTLYLGFRSSLPGENSRRPPPPTCSVLHALTTLWFSGNREYLEDFISRIDVPQLNDIDITFPDVLFPPDTPQLVQFINRTEMLNAFNRATVQFYRNSVEVTLSSKNPPVDQRSIRLRVTWIRLLDWQLQLMCLLRLCVSSLPLPLLSVLEYLDIYAHVYHWLHHARPNQWLELLRLFTSVKSLSLFDGLILPVMTALGELVGEGALEVLPVLQNVHLHWDGPSGPLQEPIGLFVAARKLSGHPVTIHRGEPGGWIEDAWEGRPLE
ncbi:hypothetical protein BJV74DRAFT_861646, partial [Russula compacta]